MQAQDWLRLGYLIVVLLVPLLPAFVLYKTLPSLADVSGPFKGLSIKLTGAFGGYFLLVLLCFGFAYFALAAARPNYEVWEVTGVVKPLDKDGHFIPTLGTSLTVQPPNFVVDNMGNFTATVMVTPGHVEGQRVFPQLLFNRQGHETVVRVVGDQNSSLDARSKRAVLLAPIELKEIDVDLFSLSGQRRGPVTIR